MADKGSNEGSSSGNISAESSDSTFQLNVKTLDSHIYSFQLDKNMSISSFKEKIANETGVPVSRQRLIFRGRVLKDEHVLSEYHLENGHTLHLVERQPNQSQVFGTSSAESTVTNDNQGNDAGPGAPHNRVGQISHSVVLGTINMGEQGEGMVPDLSGVIGAVLNSIGIGGQSRNNVSNTTQTSPPSGNETEGINAVNQNLAGNQAPLPGQTFRGQAFQSLPQVVQIPVPAGSIPIPSLNAPIPHSLNTLSEFINNMEHTLSQNGHRPNLSSTNHGDQPVELPTNAQGLPTLEALSVILRRTGQLLSVNTVAALCHIAGNLEQEGTSDLSVRGQIQSETVQTGIAMQHLGALLLELGRTMLTLRMGQSYAESSVNAGPAVYISPTGPNPIMVQPFPLQTSSLFGGSVPSSTPPTLGTVGIGRAARNVNIHIHAGTSLAPIVSSIGSRSNNGEGTRAEHHSELGSGVGVASGTETGFGISTSQPPPVTTQLSSVLSGINSRLRTIVGNMQAENTALSGQLESTSQDLPANSDSRPALRDEQRDTSEMNGRAATVSTVGCSSESGLLKPQTESAPTCSSGPRDVSVDKVVSHQGCSSRETIAKSEKVQGAPSVSEEQDVAEPGKAAPLGLGMSGLERKKQTRAQPAVSKGSGDGSSGSSANQSQQSRTDGQRLLQTLASHGSTVNLGSSNGPSQQPLPTNGSQIDMAGLMSQVLRSPALNGLLSGVSQQTGVDSQGGLRNMFQQFTQNPQMMNTVNQIAEQVGSQDIENMFAGMGSGQGGGIDLSRMFQQMMPIVSQALGGGTPPPLFSATGPQPQAPNRDGTLDRNNNQSLQPNLQPVVERIEHVSPPADVFRAVAENAAHVSGNGSASNDLLEELCSNESLASEYAEMLRNDVQQRFKEHSELDKS